MDLELLIRSWLRTDEYGSASGRSYRRALCGITDIDGLAEARRSGVWQRVAKCNKHPVIPVPFLLLGHGLEVAESGQHAGEVTQ